MGGKNLTDKEEMLLRDNYEHATEQELINLFPYRTYASIKQRANKYNNLRKKCLNEFIILDTHAIMLIKNSEGKIFDVLLDKEDVPKVQSHHSSWVAIKNRTDDYYVGDTNSYKLHRLIMNAPKGLVVDHIFHNTFDNRKQCLKIVTVAENSFNRAGSTVKSSTGVRGVQKVKDYGKYRVYISHKHYGYFNTLEEAKSVAETIYHKLSEVIE